MGKNVNSGSLKPAEKYAIIKKNGSLIVSVIISIILRQTWYVTDFHIRKKYGELAQLRSSDTELFTDIVMKI